MKTIKNKYQCPLCAGRTYGRHGVNFEHMVRCGECHFCYDPHHLGKDAILVINRLHDVINKLHDKLDAEIGECPEYKQVCQALARFGVGSKVIAGRDSEPSLRIENVDEFLRFLDTRVK